MLKKYLKLFCLVILPQLASAEGNSFFIGSGLTPHPKLAFNNLTDQFFGSKSNVSELSPFKNSVKIRSSDDPIRYSYKFPTLRFGYELNFPQTFINSLAFGLEYTNIQFPNGIGVFTEKGSLSALTLFVEIKKGWSIGNFGDLGIGLCYSETESSYKSPLLDIRTSASRFDQFLFTNINLNNYVSKAVIEFRADTDGNWSTLIGRKF